MEKAGMSFAELKIGLFSSWNWKKDNWKRIVGILFIFISRARWIVGYDESKNGELGIRVFGINLWYYKWPEPMVAQYQWKNAAKREFGEVIHSKKEEN